MVKTLGAKTRWGGRGRKFKSCHSDQESEDDKSSDFLYFTRVFRTFRVRIFCFLRHSKMSEKTRKIGLVQDLVQEFKKCISKKSRGRINNCIFRMEKGWLVRTILFFLFNYSMIEIVAFFKRSCAEIISMSRFIARTEEVFLMP